MTKITTDEVTYFDENSDLSQLPAIISAGFEKSVKDGDVILYDCTGTKTVEENEVRYWIQVYSDLAKKPPMRPATPDLSHEPENDVLGGPLYQKGELLAHTKSFVILNNKYALAKDHIMLVSKEFKPQDKDLHENDLFAVLCILLAYKVEGSKAVAFFNGGPLTGASQPHLHLQVIPHIPSPLGPEGLCEDNRYAMVIGEPVLLDLPYVHYAARLPPKPTSADVYKIYQNILSTMRSALAQVDESILPPEGPRRDSYNMIITHEHIHVIPRRERAAILANKDPNSMYARTDFRFSINALPIAGHWHIPSEQQGHELIMQGLQNMISEVGYPRSVWPVFE